MTDQPLPWEKSLALWSTSIEPDEIAASIDRLQCEYIDASDPHYATKGADAPVQLFLAAGVGYLATIFQNYLTKRAELTAAQHQEYAQARDEENTRREAAREFAHALYSNLPASAQGNDARVSIGISQHGPLPEWLTLKK